jgi:malate synthase
VLREDVDVRAPQLVNPTVADGRVSAEGVRMNVEVALLYIDAWLRGSGAVAIHNLMEDAATAEISRSQLWQWVRHRTPVEGVGEMTGERYREVRDRELARLVAAPGAGTRLDDAARLLDALVLGEFEEFLTIPGGGLLDGVER